MTFPLMPGKNILEGLQIQQRTWPNFGLFQQPHFLFFFSLPQHRHIHTQIQAQSSTQLTLYPQIKSPAFPTTPHPKGLTHSRDFSVLKAEADMGGLGFAPVPTSMATSQTSKRAAGPSWGLPPVIALLTWGFATAQPTGDLSSRLVSAAFVPLRFYRTVLLETNKSQAQSPDSPPSLLL